MGQITILTRLQMLLSNIKDKKSPNLILTIVCSAVFLDLLNLSAITIALPTLQKEFSIPTSSLQWVISAYALTFGAFLMLGGRGGDMFGHRPVLLFGMSFFALFTMVSALTPSFIGLVIARAFQGIGAAFTIPSAQAHVAIYFPDPKEKARALGVWGASGSLGFILGLILGGILTDLLGWRWIFWISLILSGVIIPAAIVILPASQSKRDASPSPELPNDTNYRKSFFTSFKERALRFDIPGISLGLPGILVLTYALTSSNSAGWGSPRIIATLILSIFLLLAFALYECRASSAILPIHLFKSTSFNLTLLLAIITYAVRQACTYFLTVQLQSYGNTPIHTSVLFIPLGISALIANTIAGRLVPIFGARFMFVLGWTLSIPGVLLFAFIEQETSYWRYTFPGMILYIAGIGTVYITANFVVVSTATKSDQGAAAGVFNVALQVGGSVVGLAVLTAVAQGMERKYGGGDVTDGGLTHVGYQSVYYSCVILCVVGLGLSLFAIDVAESMRGSFWKKVEKTEVVVVGEGATHELDHSS
ncbi:MFS general substrate transporter [Glarea lozoyensis ATCC 20868]|uniref:MFS general substrate transporter n=1 Tax=Glarea lozoyensis (strain ATCC 20868 / MF5171) TaxID=1116229 RepID=S3DJ40_GLAL2|nr:MFS general substrate transporter [Glarea lozoyensis ATCC 20868]EPE32051.1 MFS general substrate transporter [Glarea lozoyensis ATCC 20868]